MKLGIFDHMDRSGEPLDRFYEQRLQLIEAYDRAGFYGYHVAEHHATPLGVAPAPGIWLAAVARHTRQLRFGPLVYLLPLYHPIKLLEEICMLDQISGGRLLLGVGRGISPVELRLFGLDPEQAPAMYAEALEVILRGMTRPMLDFAGSHYNYQDVPMEMTPFQIPHPPLWYGLARVDSIPWAAQHKVNIVGNLPPSGMRRLTDAYRAEWERIGNDPAELPLMGVGRHVVVAETEREAMAIARRGYDRWRASFMKLWVAKGMMPSPQAVFPERYEDAEAQGRAVAGTPDKVRDFLQQTIDQSGLNYLLCRFAFGDITGNEALASVDLFTRHVMPDIIAHRLAA